MLTKEKKSDKKVTVKVRAGFGNSLVAEIPCSKLNKLDAEEMIKEVVKENSNRVDFSTTTTVKSLNKIINDPFSDIDMRVQASENMIPVSRNHVDKQKFDHIIKDKQIN